jgi:hypothetical protein
MNLPRQVRLVGAVGFVGLLVAIGYVLEWSNRPSPSSSDIIAEVYRVVAPETKVLVGSWQMLGGRSTLILRDELAVPRVILQADRQGGGRISIQDAEGQWHHYPPSPSEGKAHDRHGDDDRGLATAGQGRRLGSPRRALHPLPRLAARDGPSPPRPAGGRPPRSLGRPPGGLPRRGPPLPGVRRCAATLGKEPLPLRRMLGHGSLLLDQPQHLCTRPLLLNCFFSRGVVPVSSSYRSTPRE